MLVADLRQLVPVDLAFLAATAMALYVDGVVGTRGFCRIAVDRHVRAQLEQMALPFAFGRNVLAADHRPNACTMPVRPAWRRALVGAIGTRRTFRSARGSVPLLAAPTPPHDVRVGWLAGRPPTRAVGIRRRSFGRKSVPSMSPTIVATYRNKKSPLREFLSTDAAIPSQAATTVSQVKTTEDLRQLDIVQLDALLVAGSFRKLKRASFQPLDLGITIRPFRSRYRICLRAFGESQHSQFYVARRFLGMTSSGCFAANQEVFLPASLRKRRNSSWSAQTIKCLPDGVRRW